MAALRTACEVAERLILLAAVSAVAADMDRKVVSSWLQQEDLWNKATPAERAFLSAEHPSEKARIRFSWEMEAVYVLGWALNIIPELSSPSEQASIGDILDQMPGPGDPIKEFMDSCSLRSASEIHEAAEAALTAFAASFRAKAIGEPEPNGYDIEVALERLNALWWLIRNEHVEWDDVGTDG
jgi:hypothetical protein